MFIDAKVFHDTPPCTKAGQEFIIVVLPINAQKGVNFLQEDLILQIRDKGTTRIIPTTTLWCHKWGNFNHLQEITRRKTLIFY
jgi:hypothetical protein